MAIKKRKERINMRKLVRRILIICVALVLLYITRGIWLRGVGHFLCVETPVKKADVIYVFAGNTRERSLRAARLFDEGYAKKIVVSGELISENLKALNLFINEARVTARALEIRGVPRKNIVIVEHSTSTLEELLLLRDYMEKNKLRSVILVSSPFHMRRVVMAAHKVFAQSDYTLYFTAAHPSITDLDNWWKEETDLITVQTEYIKLGLYFIKYILLSDHPGLRLKR